MASSSPSHMQKNSMNTEQIIHIPGDAVAIHLGNSTVSSEGFGCYPLDFHATTNPASQYENRIQSSSGELEKRHISQTQGPIELPYQVSCTPDDNSDLLHCHHPNDNNNSMNHSHYLSRSKLTTFDLQHVENTHFSHKDWLNRFDLCRHDPVQVKLLRQDIIAGTIHACYERNIPNAGHALGKLLSIPWQDVIYHNTENINVDLFPNIAEMYTRIYNADCIDTALHLKKKGYNPVVLNMANQYKPGGGYLQGSGAQEESLFRRSNYYQHLDHRCHLLEKEVAGGSEIRPFHIVSKMYPLSEVGGIYSPNVVIFRENEKKGYAWSEQPTMLSFVAVAACKNPSLINGNLNDRDYHLMRQKIITILKIALAERHDCVILSAFGCGAFANPPSQIAQIFREVISSQFINKFKVITFAIFEDDNAYKSHNPSGNLYPFENILGLKAVTLPEMNMS